MDHNTQQLDKIFSLLYFFGILALNVGSTFSDGNILWLVIIALLTIKIGIDVIKAKRIRLVSVFVIYIGFIAYSCITILWSSSAKLTLTAIKIEIFSLLLFMMCWNIHSYKKLSMQEILRIIYISSFCTCVYLIIRYGFQIVYNVRSDIYDDNSLINANNYGKVYLLGLMAIYIEMKCEKNQSSKNLKKVLAIILFALMILSGSKAALITFLVFYILETSNSVKNKTLRIIVFPIILLGLIVIAYIAYNTPIFYKIIGNRFDEVFRFLSGDVPQYSSTWYRKEMIDNALSLFKNRPIFGYGIGNSYYFNRFQWVYSNGTYFHNNYLELLVGGGILGLFLYYYPYVITLSKLKMKQKNKTEDMSRHLINMIVALIISDLFSVSFYFRPIYAIVILGFMYASDELRDAEDYKQMGDII